MATDAGRPPQRWRCIRTSLQLCLRRARTGDVAPCACSCGCKPGPSAAATPTGRGRVRRMRAPRCLLPQTGRTLRSMGESGSAWAPTVGSRSPLIKREGIVLLYRADPCAQVSRRPRQGCADDCQCVMTVPQMKRGFARTAALLASRASGGTSYHVHVGSNQVLAVGSHAHPTSCGRHARHSRGAI